MGFMTVKEAADLLGVSAMTLKRWEKSGKIKTRRHPMNNYRIYTEAEIRKLKKAIEGTD